MFLSNENAIQTGGYNITNSLRFQSASSQYLSRTPASVGNRKTWTWSGWVKVGSLSTSQQCLFGHINNTGANQHTIYFVNNTIEYRYYASAMIGQRTTTQVFRDPSAWYHIVAVWDTTQATAGDRMKLYINGVQVTAFSATVNPTQNTDGIINNTVLTEIGGASQTASGYFDGYQTEVNFIDGQALTPSSFGATDATTGQWVAKKYTGTYGTNGFYLPFSNGTSTTTLGADSSGNSNNWTLNNFTRSAGVSDCWMYDVPSGNGGVSGTQPNSNYCVWSPVDKSPNMVMSKANLLATNSTAGYQSVRGTIGVTSGKWYWEVKATTTIGIASQQAYLGSTNDFVPNGGYAWAYVENGNKTNAGVNTAYGATFTSADTIGIAFDADAGTLTFYKNNVSQGVAFSGLTGQTYFPFTTLLNSTPTAEANFGQRSFSFSPPSGFKALCTANLPAATIKKGNQYMDATLYTGNLIGQAITNAASFKPDLVWIKSRSAATDNKLTDSNRGAQKALVSNSTAAETTDLTGVVSFDTGGFTLGTSTTYNNTGATYVGWQWQAGQGTNTSNTSGTITSTVSVNATAGFSIVTYTGTGFLATVGHGLGVAPKMVIIKSRSSGTANWPTYHASYGNTGCVYLNATNAGNASATLYNNTSPTSSVFTINTATDVNGSGSTYVAYCFAEIAGFSKFGSYTGNGSADGPFVYCGFRPKFIMVKRSSSTSDWWTWDTSRSPYNLSNTILYNNLASAEITNTAWDMDIVSNGFKLRTTDATVNGSGSTLIFMAFAENPFAQANAR